MNWEIPVIPPAKSPVGLVNILRATADSAVPMIITNKSKPMVALFLSVMDISIYLFNKDVSKINAALPTMGMDFESL
jgi:hypothetical protein